MPNTPKHIKLRVHQLMVRSKGKKQEVLPLSKNAPTPEKHGRAVKRLDGASVPVVVETPRKERKIPAAVLNCMWRNKVSYTTAVALMRKACSPEE